MNAASKALMPAVFSSFKAHESRPTVRVVTVVVALLDAVNDNVVVAVAEIVLVAVCDPVVEADDV